MHHEPNKHTARSYAATFDIVTFDTVTSTQDIARAAITAQLDGTTMPAGIVQLRGNTVIRAATQQSGRGRRARDWHSGLGGSYQTLLFAPPLIKRPAVSLWLAVGVARALTDSLSEACVRVMVKWPNDLYVDGKKIAGMLCEWCRGWLLVGVGVNVTNPVPSTAAQLPLALEQVHASVIAGIATSVHDWQRANGSLGETFAAWDFLAGRYVTVQTAQDTLSGIAHGVNEQGCLLLNTPCCDGHVLHWSDHQPKP